MEHGHTAIPKIIEHILVSPEFIDATTLRVMHDRRDVNAFVKAGTGMIVQSGPFSGMRMLDLSARGDGDIAPKLLGVYEQELHTALERFAGPYDAMVDVGCAEGYYSVGLALRHPGTPMMAFDTDSAALEILAKMADLNGCSEQMRLGDFCDPDALIAHLADAPRSLIIADCEGYEKTLFTPEVARAAARSDVIIECHDIWDPDITPSIQRAFTDTHRVETVYASGRDPNVFDFMSELTDWQRWRAVWERRGNRQNWLICEPLDI